MTKYVMTATEIARLASQVLLVITQTALHVSTQHLLRPSGLAKHGALVPVQQLLLKMGMTAIHR